MYLCMYCIQCSNILSNGLYKYAYYMDFLLRDLYVYVCINVYVLCILQYMNNYF